MLDGPPAPPLFDIERQRLAAYVADCAAVEPLMARAEQASANVCTAPLSSPMLLTVVNDFNALRTVANFLAGRIELAHDAGQDDVAIAQVRRVELPAVAAASRPGLVSMLVGCGIRGLQADQVLKIAPTLRIGARPGEATPAAVRALIAALLDTRVSDSELVSAFRGERVMEFDMLEAIDRGTIANPATGAAAANALMRYGIRPYLRSNELTCVRTTTAVLGTLVAPDWPTAKAKIGAVVPNPQNYGVMDLFTRILTPSFERAVLVHYRLQTDRTLAAVALAVRWHTVATGRATATWADLVPQYLPAMPADSFAVGRPLRARFDGADPILWSVNDNGVDDGGSEHNQFKGTSTPWSTDDRVLHLIPRPRDPADFTDRFRQILALDPDRPIAATPPAAPAATPPAALAATQPATPPASPPTPDWDALTGLTAWAADGGVPALSTRRDVFVALRFAEDDPATTQPAHAGGPAVRGTATFDSGVWAFAIYADGTLDLTRPNGTTLPQRWKTSPPAAGPNDFWQ